MKIKKKWKLGHYITHNCSNLLQRYYISKIVDNIVDNIVPDVIWSRLTNNHII